jgi:hypothetical protein
VITVTRLLLGILCIAAPRAAQIQATTIEPGSSLEGTIAPPQASVYTAVLNEGDTALFTVTQIGIDVVIDVIDPQGATVDSVDSPWPHRGASPHPLPTPTALLSSALTRRVSGGRKFDSCGGRKSDSRQHGLAAG